MGLATNQRVQQRIITHRDTVVTKPRKKGFFRRLGEVFVPPKKDTAIQVKTSLEYATDTVIGDMMIGFPARKAACRGTTAERTHCDCTAPQALPLQHMDRMLTVGHRPVC